MYNRDKCLTHREMLIIWREEHANQKIMTAVDVLGPKKEWKNGLKTWSFPHFNTITSLRDGDKIVAKPSFEEPDLKHWYEAELALAQTDGPGSVVTYGEVRQYLKDKLKYRDADDMDLISGFVRGKGRMSKDTRPDQYPWRVGREYQEAHVSRLVAYVVDKIREGKGLPRKRFHLFICSRYILHY